ncbi:MAG: hypothetical protein HYV42_01860 [Candidatus Magasanikbacteria bacterium]|nr:hypothetical protein [Candidatus Magasanikbacteria bacterium]
MDNPADRQAELVAAVELQLGLFAIGVERPAVTFPDYWPERDRQRLVCQLAAAIRRAVNRESPTPFAVAADEVRSSYYRTRSRMERDGEVAVPAPLSGTTPRQFASRLERYQRIRDRMMEYHREELELLLEEIGADATADVSAVLAVASQIIAAAFRGTDATPAD